MFQHILVPLDGSHLAESALPAALALAGRFEASLTLLRVIPTPQLYTSGDNSSTQVALLDSMRRQAEQNARSYLKSHAGSLRQQGYEVHIHLMESNNPATAITAAADGLDAKVIVMSTHGRSGVGRWVFGSIADKVLRQARIPVLLIRAQEETLDWNQPVTQNVFQP